MASHDLPSIPPQPPVLAPDQLARAVFDSLTAHIAVLDGAGTILAVNPAWIRFALENGGQDCASSAVGWNYLQTCRCGEDARPDGRDGADQALSGIQGVLSGALGQFALEYPCHSPTEERWFLLYVSPLSAMSGATVAHINITERKRAELQIARLAHYDRLTGLPNRALFEARLDEALAGVARGGAPLALLFLDLDGFKAVNDTHGHSIGDLLLQRVAERLARSVRAGDTAARLAGDEFTVLLPGIGNPGNAAAVARKIVAALEEPFSLDGRRVALSASVGIALSPDHGLQASHLLEQADAAMYAAKRQGKGRYAVAGRG